MALIDWVNETRTRLAEQGVRDGLAESAYELYLGAWRRSGQIVRYGEPVYEREWDLLVVLDACRADLMAEVVGDHDWLSPGRTTSVGSSSPEWLRKTFGRDASAPPRVLADTAYVTGNPYSAEYVDGDRLGHLDEVWRYAWDDEAGTIRPRPVTDRTIAAARSGDNDRVVAHYMQPHYPFLGTEIGGGMDPERFGDNPATTVWDLLRRGEVTRDAVWAAYRENLEIVLDDVALLLENVEADTVAVTADHGNLLGEFGLYGHDNGVAVPALKHVPWCTATATDGRTYEPSLEPGATGGAGASSARDGDGTEDAGTDDGTAVDDDVNARLTDLGYR